MKGKYAKGHIACIAWEEEDESSSSSSGSSSHDECVNLFLMVHNKSEDSEVYTFDLEVKPSYIQLSKAFSEMHAGALDDLKKFSLQIKLISKVEKEINHLNSALDFLKEEHASLVVEHFSTYDSLVKDSKDILCYLSNFKT